MPSLFASLAAAAGATCDAVFSEGFVLEPRALPASGGRVDVNARTVPSSARQLLPFVGTFVAAGAVMNAKGRGSSDNTTHAIAAEKPMVDVAVSALPQRPREGDIIRRDDTGEVFTVTKYLPADFGRAWIHLSDAQPRQEPPR